MKVIETRVSQLELDPRFPESHFPGKTFSGTALRYTKAAVVEVYNL